MIIFGTKTTRKLLDKGQFSCPQCQAPSPFEKRRAKQWGHLYWIPIIPMKEMPPYVECQTCRNTYIERVLDDAPGPDIAAEFERAASLIMAKMVLADGVVDASELSAMRNILAQVTGASVEPEAVDKIVAAAQSDKRSAGEIAAEFGSSLNSEGQELVLKAVLMIAAADGDFSSEEKDLAFQIGQAMGMSRAHMKGVYAEVFEN